jgi:glycosyltransferase involved in cell wall biosynthesis
VKDFCAHEGSASFVLNPQRADILQAYAQAETLVLLSQPTPTWREQLGLPVLEGLSFGCNIVCTDETGIATQLIDLGHAVVDSRSSPAEIADAVVRTMSAPIPAAKILSTLPVRDGRLEAQLWLAEARPGGRSSARRPSPR